MAYGSSRPGIKPIPHLWPMPQGHQRLVLNLLCHTVTSKSTLTFAEGDKNIYISVYLILSHLILKILYVLFIIYVIHIIYIMYKYICDFICIYSFLNIILHHGLSQEIVYSSLCYTVGLYCFKQVAWCIHLYK